MSFVLLALGMVLVIEGLAYALAPSLIKRLLETLRSLPEPIVRHVGWLVFVSGLILLWFAWQIRNF